MSGPRKFHVVEEMELRSKKNGDSFYRMAVIEKDGDTVRELYCKPQFEKTQRKLMALKSGMNFAAGPFKAQGDLNVTNHTVIMKKCGDVTVNEDIIESYVNPQVVPFSEIRGSPKKRRVSVSGTDREIRSGSQGGTMKCLKLSNDADDLVTVNVWDNVDSHNIKTGDPVKVSACEVLAVTVVTTSPSSKISSDGTMRQEAVLEAMSDTEDGFPMQLWLDNGEILTADEFFAEDLCNLQLPCQVCVEMTLKRELIDLNVCTDTPKSKCD